jgi:hypothetical protein
MAAFSDMGRSSRTDPIRPSPLGQCKFKRSRRSRRQRTIQVTTCVRLRGDVYCRPPRWHLLFKIAIEERVD